MNFYVTLYEMSSHKCPQCPTHFAGRQSSSGRGGGGSSAKNFVWKYRCCYIKFAELKLKVSVLPCHNCLA
jgi:hypothetical protein